MGITSTDRKLQFTEPTPVPYCVTTPRVSIVSPDDDDLLTLSVPEQDQMVQI